MPRSYRHLSYYEEEIIERRNQGKCNREICEMYGVSMMQKRCEYTKCSKKLFRTNA